MEAEETKEGNFTLNISITGTSEAKARMLAGGMQGLVNDLGVDTCLTVLGKIKAHPKEFTKALRLIDDPMVLSLINSF